MNHEKKINEIKKSIDDLFSDTRVTPQKTRQDLEIIRDHVDSCLDTLPHKET